MSSGTDQALLFFWEPTAEVKLERDYVSRFPEDSPERSPEFPKLLLKLNPAITKLNLYVCSVQFSFAHIINSWLNNMLNSTQTLFKACKF